MTLMAITIGNWRIMTLMAITIGKYDLNNRQNITIMMTVIVSPVPVILKSFQAVILCLYFNFLLKSEFFIKMGDWLYF